MLLNIIAVIVLVLFFSYFLKIKINVSNKNENKHDKIEEEKLPSSSSQARYEESRYAFLKFAEFVLLKKRPFGLNTIDDDTLGTISGDSRGNQGAGSSGGCKNICLNDPECNAWQYSSNDGKCQKYNISKREQITTSSSGDNIGYIFRPKDTDWAVQDLSGLPTDAKFFKAVANTVLRLNCKIEKLRNKATQVISSSNIKYCYEKEFTSGTPDKYLSERDEAISLLEDATKFFIFSGDTNEYPEQIECSLYFSIIVENMKNILFKSNNNLQSAVINASTELKSHYNNFVTVRDFFDSRLDKNYNSSINRSELTDVYEKAIKSGQGIAMDVIDSELSLQMDDCKNEESIQGLVENFFSKYDTNGDGLVHLHELLASYGIPRPSYEGGMCSSGSSKNTPSKNGSFPTKCYGCKRVTRGEKQIKECKKVPKDRCQNGRYICKPGKINDQGICPMNDRVACAWDNSKNKCVRDKDYGNSSNNSKETDYSPSTDDAPLGGGNSNTECKVHGSDRLRDWLGGNTNAPKKCQDVNRQMVKQRTRFERKGADMGDGYGGMKYTCERTREVSQDGQTQRGCTFNLNEQQDSGNGKGMRNWLKDNIGSDFDDPEGNLAKKGPCQPADLCTNQKVRT